MKRKVLAKMIGDKISSNNFNLIEGKKLDKEKMRNLLMGTDGVLEIFEWKYRSFDDDLKYYSELDISSFLVNEYYEEHLITIIDNDYNSMDIYLYIEKLDCDKYGISQIEMI